MAYKIKLQYNGESFHLEKGDIPDLEGKGTIIVEAGEGMNYQSVEGNFICLSTSQINGRCFINGVDLQELVERLGARQK
ncbi:MAG TPA: hypothetical protein VJH95_01690 [Candidatus Nanoarchaeia archaeon]|nr:hypothetical protein [Candidatus Nanoarchaeia archaeon]